MTEWSQPDRPDEQQPISSAYGPPSTSPGYTSGPGRNAPGAPADWWRRVVAIIIDGLILSIPNLIVGTALGLKTTETDPVTSKVTVHPGALAGLTFIAIIISCIYSGILEGGPHGASVGKMAMRIQIRDADDGSAIGFGRALVRRFVYQVLFLPFGIPGLINGLSPLWDRRRQAWHDKIANSVVVNSPRP
jgi:uncharacterized RDD family membrane protein YckC